MRASFVALLLVSASLLAAVSARTTESTLRLTKSTTAVTKRALPYASELEVGFGRALTNIEIGQRGYCITNKCTVLDGTKKWGASYVEVKPYQTLTIAKSVNKAYKGAVAVLSNFAGFSMTGSSWTITGGKIQATDGNNAWATLKNSILRIRSSQILGSFYSFFLLKSSLSINKAQVDFVDTHLIGIYPGSKLLVRDTSFNVKATSKTLPSTPTFYASQSKVAFTRGVLQFENIDEAYFFTCNVSLVDVQFVLINSKVTFIGGSFNSTNSVARLTNSTITFSGVSFTADRYISASSGFPSLPKAFSKPYKKIGSKDFTVSGSGTITLRSASS